MIEQKKVSIVLPVYNGEKYIGAAIDSITNQTYSNIELIIVNDCSKDRTKEIIEEYAKKDKRIKVINNTANIKLPASLNVGMRMTDGYYITWTSDDNLYKSNAIERMVLELENDKSISMVYANYTKIDELGKNIKEIKLRDEQSIFEGNVCGACFLYTRYIYNKVGDYDENLFLAEDYDYWLRIYCKGRIKHLNECLYYYRTHELSLTKTKKREIASQTLKALIKNREALLLNIEKIEQKYLLFDQILKYTEEQNRRKQKRDLIIEDKKYLVHIFLLAIISNIRKVKRKIRNENTIF